jgi:hypothetical protein
MKKSACVLTFLLLAVFSLSFGSTHPSLTAPVIVASGQLLNRNTPFQQKTLYKPTQDGMYRVSVYATLIKRDPNSQSIWSYSVQWPDAVTDNATTLFYEPGNYPVGQFYSSPSFGIPVSSPIVLQARSGNNIVQNMQQLGPPDESAYDLYWVVEQIQ